MITTQIENIVSALYPDATFALSSNYEANIDNYDLNEIGYPFIILDNMLYEDVAIQPNANQLERIRILITVLYQDDYEATDSESNTIVDQANWITLLNLKDKITYPNNDIVKDYDGEYINIESAQDVEDIVLAGFSFVNGYRSSHKTLVDSVNSCTTIQQVDNITDARI